MGASAVRIAFQGIEGSFSHIATEHFYRKILCLKCPQLFRPEMPLDFFRAEQFRQIFETVQQQRADFGVLPVENSLAGSVQENLDLLVRNDCKVVGQYDLRVEHQLLVSNAANSDLKQLRRVYSHPKALEQCQLFFERCPWIEKVVHSDTARAAQFVAAQADPSLAAIASDRAAQLYNLQILSRNIEDDPHNYTRFFLITAADKNIPGLEQDARKCSIVFSLKHQPGSLLKVLSILAERFCNLTKIESRPIHGKPFEYFFYVDFEFPPTNEVPEEFSKTLESVLSMIRQHTSELKLLGVYSGGHKS